MICQSSGWTYGNGIFLSSSSFNWLKSRKNNFFFNKICLWFECKEYLKKKNGNICTSFQQHSKLDASNGILFKTTRNILLDKVDLKFYPCYCIRSLHIILHKFFNPNFILWLNTENEKCVNHNNHIQLNIENRYFTCSVPFNNEIIEIWIAN